MKKIKKDSTYQKQLEEGIKNLFKWSGRILTKPN